MLKTNNEIVAEATIISEINDHYQIVNTENIKTLTDIYPQIINEANKLNPYDRRKYIYQSIIKFIIEPIEKRLKQLYEDEKNYKDNASAFIIIIKNIILALKELIKCNKYYLIKKHLLDVIQKEEQHLMVLIN